MEDWPLLRWRMHRYRHGRWSGESRVLDRNPTLAADVLDVIGAVGACSASDVEKHLEVDRPDRKGPWWDRSDTKVVCEQLFASGALAVDKRVAFTRHYDLSERVLPKAILAEEVSEEDAVRGLVQRSARALGVATEPDLRDYYRLSPAQTASAIEELVEDGVLERVGVRGWDAPAFVHRDVRVPRKVEGRRCCARSIRWSSAVPPGPSGYSTSGTASRSTPPPRTNVSTGTTSFRSC